MSKNAISVIHRICLYISGVCFLGLIGCWIKGYSAGCGFLVVCCAIFLPIGMSSVPFLRTYRFTACILAAVVSAMVYPQYFLEPGGVNLRDRRLIVFIVQLVMFGMGTQMSINNFIGVVKMPRAVFIGIACQFTIMPLVGYTVAKTIGFPPEIAAGIILIGSCSSGLASNVMTYMAGANLALSVTLTAIAQLIAPIMTPLWMKILASEFVQVNFLEMMINIILMVVLPIFAALIYNRLRKDRLKRLQNFMPVFSMAGIIYFTAVTTAAGRDHLLQVGAMLVIAAIFHNTAGYILGYLSCRLFGLDRDSCRTIAIEVGLQNGAMASGLAGQMGKLATVGLAPAIFSPWMNVSGSVLANFWRRRK
jgi:BASS family bile acid:Na+ symporter